MMKTAQIVLLGGLIAFTLACGYSSKTSTPQPGVMPAITQLMPASANAGAPAFNLIVNGSNFASGATINWNGTAQTTTYVSANQLTTMISASDIATAAAVPVSVTNPGTPGMGTYGMGATLAETSNAMNFTIK
jgi:hypothetical protein